MELSRKHLVSCVLVTQGKRLAEMNVITRQLRTHFADIVIWDNSKRNIALAGRFEAAKLASNDVIYTQDDDCLIHNIDSLIQMFDEEHLICNITPFHYNLYRHLTVGRGEITLLGWGSIWDRRWVDFSRYLEFYPADERFMIEADRIFTASLQRPHHYLLTDTDISELPSAHEMMALSQRRSHFDELKLCVTRLRTVYG